MLNYFSLLDELQEMLVFLNTKSNCYIIFNQNAEVIEINKAASVLLKIQNIENFMSKQLKLVIDEEFNSVTENILKGNVICDEIFNFNCADNKLLTVNIKATNLLTLKDVFLFEFL